MPPRRTAEAASMVDTARAAAIRYVLGGVSIVIFGVPWGLTVGSLPQVSPYSSFGLGPVLFLGALFVGVLTATFGVAAYLLTKHRALLGLAGLLLASIALASVALIGTVHLWYALGGGGGYFLVTLVTFLGLLIGTRVAQVGSSYIIKFEERGVVGTSWQGAVPRPINATVRLLGGGVFQVLLPLALWLLVPDDVFARFAALVLVPGLVASFAAILMLLLPAGHVPLGALGLASASVPIGAGLALVLLSLGPLSGGGLFLVTAFGIWLGAAFTYSGARQALAWHPPDRPPPPPAPVTGSYVSMLAAGLFLALALWSLDGSTFTLWLLPAVLLCAVACLAIPWTRRRLVLGSAAVLCVLTAGVSGVYLEATASRGLGWLSFLFALLAGLYGAGSLFSLPAPPEPEPAANGQKRCPACGRFVAADATVCAACGADLSSLPGTPIGILGTAQVGKTVYLTVMDWQLGLRRSPSGWMRLHGDAATSLFLEERLRELRAGQWPTATAAGAKQALHIRLFRKSAFGDTVANLRILDMAGELTHGLTRTERWEQLEEASPLVAWLRSCRGLLLLVDPANADAEDRAYQRLFLGLEKLLGLHDVERIRIPVAIVFTKNDRHRIADPAAWFAHHMPELYNVAAVKLERWRAFACSAVGSTVGERPPPVPVPVGVLEPLEFVLSAGE